MKSIEGIINLKYSNLSKFDLKFIVNKNNIYECQNKIKIFY